jgi:hypothetical protein
MMRWDSLFEDLEGQLEQELDAEELDLRAEEERLRIGRMSLRDRVVAAADFGHTETAVELTLTGGLRVGLVLSAYGRDWVAGEAVGELTRRGTVVVPVAAIAALSLPGDAVPSSIAAAPAGPPTPLADRLGLAFVLRTMCRRRAAVELVLPGGPLHGTIDRVGRDHLDLAVHEPGTARRRDAVRRVSVVPFAQLLLVRI